MLNKYIDPAPVLGTCLHNTRNWQVTEMARGLGVELLLKRRDICPVEAARLNLSLHSCYPSIFMQDEPASEFLAELKNAQKKLSRKDVDWLLLNEYLVLTEFA